MTVSFEGIAHPTDMPQKARYGTQKPPACAMAARVAPYFQPFSVTTAQSTAKPSTPIAMPIRTAQSRNPELCWWRLAASHCVHREPYQQASRQVCV